MQNEAELREEVARGLGQTKLWQDYELSTKARARLRPANAALDDRKEAFSQAVADEICEYRTLFDAAANVPATPTSTKLLDRLLAAQRRLRASLDACEKNSTARQRLAEAIRPSPSPLRSLAGLQHVRHLVLELERALRPLRNPARRGSDRQVAVVHPSVRRWKRLALRLLGVVKEFHGDFRRLGGSVGQRLSQNTQAEYLGELLAIARAQSVRGTPPDTGSIKNWLGSRHKPPAKTARRS